MEILIVTSVLAAVVFVVWLLAKLVASRRHGDLYVTGHSKGGMSSDPDFGQRVSSECLRWISQEEGKH